MPLTSDLFLSTQTDRDEMFAECNAWICIWTREFLPRMTFIVGLGFHINKLGIVCFVENSATCLSDQLYNSVCLLTLLWKFRHNNTLTLTWLFVTSFLLQFSTYCTNTAFICYHSCYCVSKLYCTLGRDWEGNLLLRLQNDSLRTVNIVVLCIEP